MSRGSTVEGKAVDATLFRKVRDVDFRRLPDEAGSWLAAWELDMDQDGIFREHRSKDDLIVYMNAWNKERFTTYFEPAAELVDLSFAVTRKVYERVRTASATFPDLRAPLPVDYRNAEDFTFQNAYPIPERAKISRILDFGPGYGRQINIWAQRVPNLVYCGMEAIENGYCCQNLYWTAASLLPVIDYVADPERFRITAAPGIYHLPTWRYDLLPSDFFDLVIAVGVLPELSDRLALHLLELFKRCLKVGGALYIRDHDLRFLPASHTHTLDLHELLPSFGFQLEFRPYLHDLEEIHGVPRLWRKIDPSKPFRPVDPNFPGQLKTSLSNGRSHRFRDVFRKFLRRRMPMFSDLSSSLIQNKE
jgi:SAM-dependent methyltransferase